MWVCVCVSVFIATAWAHLLMAPAVDCRLSVVCIILLLFIYYPRPLLATPLLSCLWFVCRRCCGVHFCGVYVTSVGFYNAGICHQALTPTLTRKFPEKKEREREREPSGCSVDFYRFRQRFPELKDEGGGATETYAGPLQAIPQVATHTFPA